VSRLRLEVRGYHPERNPAGRFPLNQLITGHHASHYYINLIIYMIVWEKQARVLPLLFHRVDKKIIRPHTFYPRDPRRVR
jgi:hypothetical protein